MAPSTRRSLENDGFLSEVSSSSVSVRDFVNKHDIAWEGNGLDHELSKDQLKLILQLHELVTPDREALSIHDEGFCDYEACRRYLVARNWNLGKAQEQLISTLKWRSIEDPARREYWESPKNLKNPLSMSLRLVGIDVEGRPIAYSCFREAHHRFDVDANTDHVLLLIEATRKILSQRRSRGLNKTASSRQMVLVVDFDGFSLRDNNPRSGILTAQLLQHYPEMLHLIVLIDAPILFNGFWKIISPLLDDRVRSKVMFVKGKDAGGLLEKRLGKEAAQWIEQETIDNKEKLNLTKKAGHPPKRYWIPPADDTLHDARGLSSYVHSEFYVKTPGDAYEEIRAGINPGSTKKKPNTIIKPFTVQTLLQGSF